MNMKGNPSPPPLSGLLSEVHGGDGRANDWFAYFMVAYPLYVRRIVTDMGGIRLGGVGGGEHHDIFYSFIFHSQEAAGKMWQGDVRATARHKTGELLAEGNTCANNVFYSNYCIIN